MRKILFIYCLMMSLSLFAQRDINAYQNMIVPAKFDFVKKENQYNLNTLTKMYFEKYGFKVYMDNAVPPELLGNPCNNLYVTVAETGNFMKTKMQVFIKDCKKENLFISEVGSNKEKEYHLSYNLALRAALNSFEKINYQYQPEAIENSEPQKRPEQPIVSDSKQDNHRLLAKPTANGFELVDKEGITVMKLLKTSRSDMFTAFKSGQQGALIAKEGHWFFEYYQGEEFISEPVLVEIPNQ